MYNVHLHVLPALRSAVSEPLQRVLQEGNSVMTRWVTTTQPAAALEQEPGPPSTDAHGSEVTYWRTAFGKRFARVVEKQGFVFWMREVE